MFSNFKRIGSHPPRDGLLEAGPGLRKGGQEAKNVVFYNIFWLGLGRMTEHMVPI